MTSPFSPPGRTGRVRAHYSARHHRRPPYRAEAHLVFDHRASELIRTGGQHADYMIDADALSAARVVYGHLGGPPLPRRL